MMRIERESEILFEFSSAAICASIGSSGRHGTGQVRQRRVRLELRLEVHRERGTQVQVVEVDDEMDRVVVHQDRDAVGDHRVQGRLVDLAVDGQVVGLWKRATAWTVAASITPLTGTPTCCWIIRTDCWS
jgi:hypothetical protein